MQHRPEAEAKISAVYTDRSLTMLNMLASFDKVRYSHIRLWQSWSECIAYVDIWTILHVIDNTEACLKGVPATLVQVYM